MRTTPADKSGSLPPVGGIKRVPQEGAERSAIRAEAERAGAELSRGRPLRRAELEALGLALLARLGMDKSYLGFAMVAVSNFFWREQFAGVPYERRLLLLPHCLRKKLVCRGNYSSAGLDCAGCGACDLKGLKERAESLGYRVLIAEGTPVVVQLLLNGDADAILGVACLDSLESSFERVSELGIPHAAVPLLASGCFETRAEAETIEEWMRLRLKGASASTRTFVPLLRHAQTLFEDAALDGLLAGHVELPEPREAREALDPLSDTQRIALDWLEQGGKRFRPFVTLAGYAALTQGPAAFSPRADTSGFFTGAVNRVAAAIEALHKASLVHDDIEDDDLYRYGRSTLHRRYGCPTALNVGDYLVGLGYRLIGSAREEFGDATAADLLAEIGRAHTQLCRGQGAEIFWREKGPRHYRARDMQAVYALKTSPAFEAALYAGVRMAQAKDPSCAAIGARTLRPFCRVLGVAY